LNPQRHLYSYLTIIKMTFSRLAYLGGLNKFSKNSLCELVSTYEITVQSVGENFEVIRFCGDGTKLDIKYDLAGNFMQIVREEWLDQGLLFQYKLV
jgi:hypothetical protein